MRDATLIGPWVRRFLLEHVITDRNFSRNTQMRISANVTGDFGTVTDLKRCAGVARRRLYGWGVGRSVEGLLL